MVVETELSCLALSLLSIAGFLASLSFPLVDSSSVRMLLQHCCPGLILIWYYRPASGEKNEQTKE